MCQGVAFVETELGLVVAEGGRRHRVVVQRGKDGLSLPQRRAGFGPPESGQRPCFERCGEDRADTRPLRHDGLRVASNIDRLRKVVAVEVPVCLLRQHPRVRHGIVGFGRRDPSGARPASEGLAFVQLDQRQAHQTRHVGSDARQPAEPRDRSAPVERVLQFAEVDGQIAQEERRCSVPCGCAVARHGEFPILEAGLTWRTPRQGLVEAAPQAFDLEHAWRRPHTDRVFVLGRPNRTVGPEAIALGQELVKLLARDLEVLGKLRPNPRVRPACDLATLPAPHRGSIDAQPFGKRLLRETECPPPGGEAMPFDCHLPPCGARRHLLAWSARRRPLSAR